MTMTMTRAMAAAAAGALRVLAVVWLASACARAPSPAAQHGGAHSTSRAGRATTEHAPSWFHSPDGLAFRMREIRDALDTFDLQPGVQEANGFLSNRETATRHFTVPAKQCMLIVAIASGGLRDMDATLFSPEGYVLAEDSEPHAHPLVQVCAGTVPRRVYYDLRVRSGVGAYWVATFLGTRAQVTKVVHSLTIRPSLAASTPDEARYESKLRDFTQSAQRRNFEMQGRPTRVRAQKGQRVRLPVLARPYRCYTIAAFAIGAIESFDLNVLSESGSELAHDTSQERQAAVQFCPRSDTELSAEIVTRDGVGEVGVAVYQGHVAVVGGPSATWLGSGFSSSPSARVEQHVMRRLQMGQWLGYGEPQSAHQGQLRYGEVQSHRIRLVGGECTRVIATYTQGVRRLEMRLYATDSSQIAHRMSTEGIGTVNLCALQPRVVDVQVVSLFGRGEYSILLARRRYPTFWQRSLSEAQLGQVLDVLEDGAAEGWTPAPSENASAALARDHAGADAMLSSLSLAQSGSEAEPASLSYAVPPKACLRVQVLALPDAQRADAEPIEVQATLRRGRNSVARAVGEEPVLTSCNTKSATAPIQVELRRDHGPLRAVVIGFVRTAPSSPAQSSK
jgi:hypothetical protein